jgi:hypothetical protein
MLEGLRKPSELIVTVVTLLAYGCPIQAIVHAYELDERTVASWRDRAGRHCEQVHHALIEQGTLDLVHVQADEIRVKGRSMMAWMGLTMMVSTRLWLGGVVSLTRDSALADRMMGQVRACSQAACALLVCTDGWAAYPNSITRAFRDPRQRDDRARTSGLARLAAAVYCDGDQTDAEETRGGSDAPNDARRALASQQAPASLSGRNGPQYRFYRTLEWNHARAVSGLNAHMSSCRSPCGGSFQRDVSDRMYLQPVLAAS